MKKTRTEYSILNIITGLGGYVLNTVLGLICRMAFTRTLSAEYLGVSGLFTNILSMLSLAELGIGSAIVYALYKPLAVDDKEKVASLVKFYGQCYRVIGIAVAAIGLALMPVWSILIQCCQHIFLQLSCLLANGGTAELYCHRCQLFYYDCPKCAANNLAFCNTSLYWLPNYPMYWYTCLQHCCLEHCTEKTSLYCRKKS